MTRLKYEQPSFRNAGRLFALLLLGVLAGCNDGRPERVAVSGKVMIDGQPLEYGNIVVHAANHRPAMGSLGTGGRFTLSTYEYGDGCVTGSHAVTINAMEVLDPNTLRWHTPKKYSYPDTSGLTLEVTDATDAAEISLAWEGGKPFIEHIRGGGD